MMSIVAFEVGGRRFEIRSAIVEGEFRAELFENGCKVTEGLGIIREEDWFYASADMRKEMQTAIERAIVQAVTYDLSHSLRA